MYKLVVLCRYDPLTKAPDQEQALNHEFETSALAELRALLWLHYRPNDLVMLVEIETDVCKHCDQPIEEKAGWVLHKWVHKSNGAYLCWSNEHTKAEPKEDVRENT